MKTVLLSKTATIITAALLAACSPEATETEEADKAKY